MKKIGLLILFLILATVLTGCLDADVASQNISQQADQFKIDRRIVFYDGINGDYILTIEGKCSLGNYDLDKEVSVICKVGENAYVKHFLGLSDNVTYFAEQLLASPADSYHYQVILKPQTLIPDFEFQIKP